MWEFDVVGSIAVSVAGKAGGQFSPLCVLVSMSLRADTRTVRRSLKECADDGERGEAACKQPPIKAARLRTFLSGHWFRNKTSRAPQETDHLILQLINTWIWTRHENQITCRHFLFFAVVLRKKFVKRIYLNYFKSTEQKHEDADFMTSDELLSPDKHPSAAFYASCRVGSFTLNCIPFPFLLFIKKFYLTVRVKHDGHCWITVLNTQVLQILEIQHPVSCSEALVYNRSEVHYNTSTKRAAHFDAHMGTSGTHTWTLLVAI